MPRRPPLARPPRRRAATERRRVPAYTWPRRTPVTMRGRTAGPLLEAGQPVFVWPSLPATYASTSSCRRRRRRRLAGLRVPRVSASPWSSAGCRSALATGGPILLLSRDTSGVPAGWGGMWRGSAAAAGAPYSARPPPSADRADQSSRDAGLWLVGLVLAVPTTTGRVALFGGGSRCLPPGRSPWIARRRGRLPVHPQRRYRPGAPAGLIEEPLRSPRTVALDPARASRPQLLPRPRSAGRLPRGGLALRRGRTTISSTSSPGQPRWSTASCCCAGASYAGLGLVAVVWTSPTPSPPLWPRDWTGGPRRPRPAAAGLPGGVNRLMYAIS